MQQIIDYSKTYGVACLGMGLFYFINLPLPFLLGPIFLCLVVTLCGVQLKTIEPISDGMRTILGVAIGATITVALLLNIISIWPSLLLMVFMIVLIGLIGIPYFHYLWKYDFITAYYASMPGGLQDMILFGKEAGANIRSLALVHSTRVFVIVTILPIILINIWQFDLSNPPGMPIINMPINQILIMIFAGLFGWYIAKKVGLFGASILGPLIAAAILSLLGILTHRPPAEAIWMAQYFIGASIGVKYVGITIQELRRDIIASFGFCIFLGLITLIFYYTIIWFSFNTPIDILLAFTPGGQAEITILALIIGADISFIITHHLLRIVLVIILSPIMMKLFTKN